MTDLELFPRGKGAAAGAVTPTSSSKQDGRKRKAPTAAKTAKSPRGEDVKEKDWLFGAGHEPSKASSGAKRPRGDSSATAASSNVPPGASKGKVCVACFLYGIVRNIVYGSFMLASFSVR